MKTVKCTSDNGRHKWDWIRNKTITAGKFGAGLSIRLSRKGVYRCAICDAEKTGEPGTPSPQHYLDRNISVLLDNVGCDDFGAGRVQKLCGVGYNQAVATMERAVSIGKAVVIDDLRWSMSSTVCR